MVIGLFGATLAFEAPVDRVLAAPANRIAATAFRWSWEFSYPNGRSVYGTPAAPPTLYLPLGEATEIDLRSADVTHSFWVPAFLFKRDAIPGMTNVVRPDAHAPRRVPRALRAVLRPRSRGDDVRGAGGAARRLRSFPG